MNCPHLGIRQDPNSRFIFPTNANYCHKVTPVDSVRRAYQEKVCLSAEYQSCPIFQQDWQGELPSDIRGRISKKTKKMKYSWVGFGLVIFLLAVLGGYILFVEVERFAFWGDRNLPAQAVVISVTNTPLQTPQLASSPIIAATETTDSTSLTHTPTSAALTTPTKEMISASLTPSSIPYTPGPGLGTPFGAQGEFLLHQVKFGDNLPNLAKQYQTDRDVIVAANGLLPDVPLQPDQVIVVMPGLTDSLGIEHLIVKFLSEDTIISELAPQHGVTVAEIRNYNQLGLGEIIPAGRWLIFPKRAVTPTAIPTAIPTPDLSYALTEPFGPNAEYVLHKVASNESTYTLEGIYLTSAAVIRALNDIEGSIQPGQVLVILLERKDPSGITPLSVFYVEDALQVEAVADYLGILTADLLYYNNLESGEIIPAGRYVIYPTPLEE